MSNRTVFLGCALFMSAALATPAVLAKENPAIAYRKSVMTLLGSNFGPMSMTAKGDIPWDDARMAAWGKDLKTVTSLNILRGFPEDSGTGKTNAKPEIWQNFDDFKKKLETMQLEAAKLGDLAAAGDRKAITEQIAVTGKSCKSCHEKYEKEE